jgi:hypothetical protein
MITILRCSDSIRIPSVGSVNNDARSSIVALDMAYAWAPTGKGLPDNYKTGYYGQAFLESPGNGTERSGR